MDPKVWGPSLWNFLHICSFNYPKNPTRDDIMNHNNFLNSLKYIIPCANCQTHYSEYLNKHPPKLNSQMDFITWVIDLHNDVNKRNNKKIYSYDESLELIRSNMENKNKSQSTTKSKNIYIAIFVVLVIIIILLLLYIFKNMKTKKVIRY